MPAKATEYFMTINQKQQSQKADSDSKQPTAADVSQGDGDSHPERNDSGKGAPPCNTAPDKCNSSFFQPLRWGVDSLYLSYHGEMFESVYNELRDLKTLAQGRKDLAAKAQYPLSGHRFEVMDKGSGLYPFTLVDDAFRIRLASHKAKAIPIASVQVSSNYLSHQKPIDAELHLRDILRPIGELKLPTVSRIDIFVDFASSFDMESLGRQAWVTKASSISQYVQGDDFSGWSIGAGGAVMARLYNKQMEIQKSGKLYLEDLWEQVGWDNELPVWRLEFQFKREILHQLGLDTLPSIMSNLNGLWSYATTQWLKLAIPSETDKTRSRWDIHPLWELLSSIDWESDGGPLIRQYSPSRAPNKQWLGQRALGAMASIASIEGINDFDEALNVLGNAAFQVLADQAFNVGIPEMQHFQEKVAVLNRKYNTSLNLGDDETAEDALVNEYRRLSKGY